MSSFSLVGIWWQAIRPKTLSISLTPVLVGNALAWQEQLVISWPVFIITLTAALCIQIGTNLYNDAADFEKGADNAQRLGPKRATQQGWLTSSRIKRTALISFSCAFVLGIYLAWIGGWPIILLGLSSLACGYAYTAGPKPIAYSASGELFVMLFFGVFAVTGSYYLQTAHISSSSLWISTAIGSMAAAILLVNNYRDLDSDRMANKLTLVHYLGRKSAQHLYAALMVYPYGLIAILVWASHMVHSAIWLALFSLPLALYLIQQIYSLPISTRLNRTLAQTAQLQLLYSLLISLGLVL